MVSPASLHLRPVVPSDIEALFQIQLDPKGNALAGTKPRDRDTFEGIWNRILTDPTTRDSTVARAIIAERDGEGVLVGSINIFRRDDLDFVGYWIDGAGGHWGKGYAGRALALLLEEVPPPLRRPLHARVAAHNAASLRVLERNGFVITGREHSPETERFLACEEVMLMLA